MNKEFRPWGYYAVLHEADGFKVKVLAVKTGGQLSLQSHKRRSEHWTVTQGRPTTTVGDEVRVLQKGDSIDIPLGAKHRLENFHEEEVLIVEVQFGDYLEEDDIVRYEDVYNRS